MSDAIIVFTSLPDREAALKLANELVAKKLAACVNVLSECTSVDRWKGTVEIAHEVPVLIKTRAARFAEVEDAIRGLHPYELPEIVAVPIARGCDDYLQWVADETSISVG
jgi:periplasmic divalent cation tolerance protein